MGGHLKNPRLLEELENLSELGIVRPSFDPSELPHLPGVKSMDFHAWTNLSDMVALSSMPVRDLRLSSCKHIVDYQAIESMVTLESIYLDDCSPLSSARLLQGLLCLKKIVLTGTEFQDKDISCLNNLGLSEIRLSGSGYSPDPEWLVRR